MNYYKQVAEMLGVELNEEFKVAYGDGALCEKSYKITVDGLFYKNALGWVGSSFMHSIIKGDIEIVKIPWKPSHLQKYYVYSIYHKKALETNWQGVTEDFLYWKLGNCFRTREESESKGKEIMEKIEKEYRES